MLKRLILGLIVGLFMGGAVGMALLEGLHMPVFSNALVAYAAAAVTGVLTGLVAGKPIWAQDGRIEAGLKAFFGALLAAGLMFALRKWVHVPLDLTSLGGGAGEVGELPIVSLPMIATALALFFAADNTEPK